MNGTGEEPTACTNICVRVFCSSTIKVCVSVCLYTYMIKSRGFQHTALVNWAGCASKELCIHIIVCVCLLRVLATNGMRVCVCGHGSICDNTCTSACEQLLAVDGPHDEMMMRRGGSHSRTLSLHRGAAVLAEEGCLDMHHHYTHTDGSQAHQGPGRLNASHGRTGRTYVCIGVRMRVCSGLGGGSPHSGSVVGSRQGRQSDTDTEGRHIMPDMDRDAVCACMSV